MSITLQVVVRIFGFSTLDNLDFMFSSSMSCSFLLGVSKMSLSCAA